MDSFCGFISWIRFVKTKIPNYLIHFLLKGFVYNSRILTYNSFNQYIITPLSLVWPPASSSTLRHSSADAIWRSDTERLSSSTKDTLDSNHHHNCCWSEINNDPIRHLFNCLRCNSELLMAHYTFCNTCKTFRLSLLCIILLSKVWFYFIPYLTLRNVWTQTF